MSRRAFNSIQGFSVGENPNQDIILANGDITTVNFTANGVSNLGPIGNVKITGGAAGQTIITDGTGNLVFTGISGNSAAVMPYFIPADKSYTVPTNFQGLFTQPIEIDGELEIDGILVQVGTPINAINRQVLFNNNGEITGTAGFTFEQSSGNLSIPGNVIVTGNVLPPTDVVYNLGSSTRRWKDLFLSGTTIYVGGGTISSGGGEMVLTNSQGGTLSVVGNGSSTSTQLVNGNTSITVQSSNVVVTVNAIPNIAVFSSAGLSVTGIANVTGNAIVAGILTDNYYYANGYPLDVGGNPGGSNTQVQYNNAGAFAGSANMTFDGTSLTLANGASIQGLTVGRGAGAVSTNTVFGASAYQANTTGSNSVVVGNQAGYTNSTGIQNVFIGTQAGYAATGRDSTFVGTGAGGAITSGTNNTIIGQYDGNGDGLDIRTASNYAVISDGDGNRLLSTANGYSLALDGGAVPQTGTGITFPASQSASTDPQTLDDYEEGTWTPTLSSITNWTGTPTTTYAKYIKIGKSVFMEFQFSGTVTAGSTATYFIITLPITATSTSVSGGANVAEGYNGAVLAQNSTSCYIFFTAATGLTSGAHNPTGTATYSSAS